MTITPSIGQKSVRHRVPDRPGTGTTERLLAAIGEWEAPRILVVGDLILDRYTWGKVQRISPEAPVPVLRYDREEYRLGGGAAVAGLLASLGARVACAGVVGNDSPARELRRLVDFNGIDSAGILTADDRPTTVKQRFLSSQHGHTQMLRVDVESDEPVSRAAADRVWAAIAPRLADSDAVLVSDYAKGACAPDILSRLVEESRQLRVPVLIDPARGRDYRLYSGATVLTPNRAETELAAGAAVRGPHDALRLGELLRRQAEVGALVVKLDHEGLVLAAGEASRHYPTRSQVVFDVTGAGDTVIAVLGLCLAAGQPWDVACPLANLAGGAQVRRVGVSQLTREQLIEELHLAAGHGRQAPGVIVTIAEASALSVAARSQGRTVVFTNGCFAALHAGHVAYLKEARELGDLLIVACNSGRSVRQLKGERAVIPDSDRLKMLASLDCVDAALLFEDDTPHRILEAIRPDVLVKGGTTPEIVGREFVESYGGRVVRLGAVTGVSTTRILREVASGADAAVEEIGGRGHVSQVAQAVDCNSESSAESRLAPQRR